MYLCIYKQSKLLPNQKSFFQITCGLCSRKYNKHSYQKCDQSPQPHFKLCVKQEAQELFSSYHLPTSSPLHRVTAVLVCSGHHMPKDSNKTTFFFFLPLCSQQAHSLLSVIRLRWQVNKRGFFLSVESNSVAPFPLVQDFTLDVIGRY